MPKQAEWMNGRLRDRSIDEIYVTLERTIFQTQSDDFTVKVASSLEEYCKLLEVGFEYVSDYSDKKVLRKRK